MTSRQSIAFAVSVAILAMVASPARAQKNLAVATFSAPFTGGDTVTATIAKGKKKRFLLASATAFIGDLITVGTYCDLVLTLKANDVAMLTASSAGQHARTTCDCPTIDCAGCTATATAYLDLDAAEAANPGVFVKEQIDVDLGILVGGDGACVGGLDDVATLIVQMIKK